MTALGAAILQIQTVYPTRVGLSLTYASLPSWTYLTFTQNIYMALVKSGGANVLGVTWSLAIEEQFYLALPFVILVFRRRSVAIGAVALLVATPIIRAYEVLLLGNWHSAYLMTPGRLDALSLGILVAILIRDPQAFAFARHHQTKLNILAGILVLAQVADMWALVGHATGNDRPLLQLSVICAQFPLLNVAQAILMLSLFTRSGTWLHALTKQPVLTGAGARSYAAYMYHEPVNWASYAMIYPHQNPSLTWDRAYMPILVIGVTFSLATLSYRYFEMPIRRWAHTCAVRDPNGAAAQKIVKEESDPGKSRVPGLPSGERACSQMSPAKATS
jgi:peptidoglycan/LPS O-acetylase OafA/YrhL